MSFRLTYATMFDPPEAMHERFDSALATVRAGLGARHLLHVGGEDRPAARYAACSGPIDRRVVLGEFAVASRHDVTMAMESAEAAYPAWRGTPAAERVRLLRRVADVMEARVYEISAALALEVGKNRMEALGEAQETVDFFRHYADDFESHGGYDHELPNDPLPGVVSRNRSVMRPYGTWVVIAPFNFPLALAGGPAAAALVTGNTVVVKGATDTPWAGRLLADCVRDAGLPPGVFNYLSGSGRDVGEALVAHPHTAGITFTGSVAVGRRLMQQMAGGAYPRPCIAEMGGKNPCIVTAGANLDDAAAGIVRSAYGMGGQKCSALSRLYVEEPVADALIERLRAGIAAIRVGDPCLRESWLGPVINAAAAAGHHRYVDELAKGGAHLVAGVGALEHGAFAHGHY
ncbi:MAG: aldehyde dehydrogenase family protein, partial [Lysobacterales bacterium]